MRVLSATTQSTLGGGWQQNPAVITNFCPTLPTTVPGAEREAGGPKTLNSVSLLLELPALLLARHLHWPESAYEIEWKVKVEEELPLTISTPLLTCSQVKEGEGRSSTMQERTIRWPKFASTFGNGKILTEDRTALICATFDFVPLELKLCRLEYSKSPI